MGSSTLTWNYDSAAGDGFRIYRSDTPMDPEALPTPLDEVAIDVREYVDSTVVADQTYYYRVSVFAGTTENVSAELEHLAADTGDDLWSSVVALINFENGVTDEKGFNWSNSNTVVDTVSKFGTHSLDCGAGATTVSNSVLGLVSSDPITFEFWMNVTSDVSDGVVFQLGSNNNASTGRIIGMRVSAGGALVVYFGTSASTAGSATIPDFAHDTWYHIVVQVGPSVSGNRSCKIFIDGVLSSSDSSTPLTGLSSSNILSLGQGYWTAVKRFNGYLDEFRVTKAERYTADFTPPTEPYPNFGV